MANSQQFTGLTMPVLSAFGWTGEEAAMTFALSQLEEFINLLYEELSIDMRRLFPYHGLDREGRRGYFSTQKDPDSGVAIEFSPRPLSLRIGLSALESGAIRQALDEAKADGQRWFELVGALGEGWNLQIQQVRLRRSGEEETETQALYDGPVRELDLQTAVIMASQAALLNDEEQWRTPIRFVRRLEAEKVAALGMEVIRHTQIEVSRLLPLLKLFLGKLDQEVVVGEEEEVVELKPVIEVEETVIENLKAASKLSEFVYVADLKALHIKKGFINLTPLHWPFFARTARAATREVSVLFNEEDDDNSSVWRLVDNEQARLVLGQKAQRWMVKQFAPRDRIIVEASKVDGGNIEVRLSHVN